MNLCYKLLKHAQKFPQNTVHWTKPYRRQRNYVTQKIRKAEADYWKSKFEKAGNSRDFWKIVRAMQGQKKNHKIGPIQDDQRRILTDDKIKVESFNQYFATVGEKLAEKIQIQDDSVEQQHIHRVTPVINNTEITNLEVSEAITKRVKPGKGCGPDDISAKDVHLIGKFASIGLTTVIQNSVARAQYPSRWRLSRVWAIPKKGNKLGRGNYHPISLLNIPSKVYESIICDQLDSHITKNGLSNKHQWGFTEGKSTELLMLHLTETWKMPSIRGKSWESFLSISKKHSTRFTIKQ